MLKHPSGFMLLLHIPISKPSLHTLRMRNSLRAICIPMQRATARTKSLLCLSVRPNKLITAVLAFFRPIERQTLVNTLSATKTLCRIFFLERLIAKRTFSVWFCVCELIPARSTAKSFLLPMKFNTAVFTDFHLYLQSDTVILFDVFLPGRLVVKL